MGNDGRAAMHGALEHAARTRMIDLEKRLHHRGGATDLVPDHCAKTSRGKLPMDFFLDRVGVGFVVRLQFRGQCVEGSRSRRCSASSRAAWAMSVMGAFLRLQGDSA